MNEVGFQLVAAAFSRAASIEDVASDNDTVELIQRRVTAKIHTLARSNNNILDPLSQSEFLEATEIASRLERYFDRPGGFIFEPEFRGCGVLLTCHGDAISDRVLYEVKSGDRPFRSLEFRQLITYGALNYCAGGLPIESFGVVNPRTGRAMTATLRDFARHVSGKSPEELFGDIIQFISSSGVSR